MTTVMSRQMLMHNKCWLTACVHELTSLLAVLVLKSFCGFFSFFFKEDFFKLL